VVETWTREEIKVVVSIPVRIEMGRSEHRKRGTKSDLHCGLGNRTFGSQPALSLSDLSSRAFLSISTIINHLTIA
jgi:hypothetical protein